ncbi:MAG: hypothetical protein ACFFDN_37575, partial [Candidatus Hodarchaeota archaeon]
MKRKMFTLSILLLLSLTQFIPTLEFEKNTEIGEEYFILADFISSLDLNSNFDYIEKDKANSTRNGLEVNQTIQSNKTQLNWLAQNDGGMGSPPEPQIPAGDISKDFNITAIDNYNRTYHKIIIQNVSAEPTWKDIEENTTLINAAVNRTEIADIGTTYQCAAMEFNLTEDSRVTTVAWYGRVIDSVNSEWYVEIWNRSSQWQGAPGTRLTRIILTSSDPVGWTSHNFDLNLTQGSYFFIINGSNLDILINGDLVYWAKIPDSGGGTDGSDDGDVYVYSGAWGTPFPTFDVSLKVQTVLIDSNNDTLININPENIDLNMTIDSIVYDVNSSNYEFNFTNLNEIGNKTVTLTSNNSFSCNLTWTTLNFNNTNTDSVAYNVTKGVNYAIWKFNYTVSFPTPTYGETLYDYDVSIFKPNPSWNMIEALNSTNQNVTSGIVEDSSKIYLSNNTAPILTQGTWKFTCQNPLQSLVIQLNNSANAIYKPQSFLHGEGVQVNASISGTTNGVINLTIYNSTNADVTSDWTPTNSSTFDGLVSFNLTVPSSASTGNYTIQTVWTNESYAAINQTYILVVNSTELTMIDETQINNTHLIGTDLNITVYYNNTFGNSSISGANLTIKIFNETDHSLVLQDNLTARPTPGYYNYTLSTDNFVNATYLIIINASKEWYNNASKETMFTLIYNTSLIRLEPTNILTSDYEPFNLTIIIRYIDLKKNLNISDANVNFTMNSTPGPKQNGTLNWHLTNKTYYIQLNSSDYALDTIYEINITASKLGYLTQIDTIYWNISSDNTNPTVIIDGPVNKLNTTANSVQVNWTSSYDLESGIEIYQVFNNGSSQYIGTLTVFTVSLVEGWNNITVVAQDYA